MLLEWFPEGTKKKKKRRGGGCGEGRVQLKKTNQNKWKTATTTTCLNENNPKLLPSRKATLYSRCLWYRSLWAADGHLISQRSAFSGARKSWAANVVCALQVFPPEPSQTSCFAPCPQAENAACSTVPPSTVPCSQSCATPTSASVQKVRIDHTGWSQKLVTPRSN